MRSFEVARISFLIVVCGRKLSEQTQFRSRPRLGPDQTRWTSDTCGARIYTVVQCYAIVTCGIGAKEPGGSDKSELRELEYAHEMTLSFPSQACAEAMYCKRCACPCPLVSFSCGSKIFVSSP